MKVRFTPFILLFFVCCGLFTAQAIKRNTAAKEIAMAEEHQVEAEQSKPYPLQSRIATTSATVNNGYNLFEQMGWYNAIPGLKQKTKDPVASTP